MVLWFVSSMASRAYSTHGKWKLQSISAEEANYQLDGVLQRLSSLHTVLIPTLATPTPLLQAEDPLPRGVLAVAV